VTTDITLPEVGEGIESGTVVTLLVSLGDRVEVDQPILELETDKAVVEMPATATGVVEILHVEVGQEVKIGQTIVTLNDQAESKPEITDKASEHIEAKDKSKTEPESDLSAAQVPDHHDDSGVKLPISQLSSDPKRLIPAAPSVRRLAREIGVDINLVDGKGILGRISAADVRRFAETGTVSVSTAGPTSTTTAFKLPDFQRWGETERKPMSGIRKATVRSMTTAWATVPMVTQFDKADITEFEAIRKSHQPKAKEVGTKLTPTAMLIKVVASALCRFPDFNASIDIGAEEVVYKSYVNVGVAVDTDNGLLVPIIKNADTKNVIDLSKELGELAERARTRKLSLEEMQGGNFTVSNLGGIGGTGFTPIVNPPDVAILGISRGVYEPVYNIKTNDFSPRLIMPMALTYDHRLIDGASAARFLRWVCEAIEEPFLLALEG
jgi:pyruvate dehydrogenase E2 component (dihydrolipoamide acetyltransferase)